MKSIIYKQHIVRGKVRSTSVYLFGVCIYCEEYPEQKPEQRKPVGFIQFPSDAPTEVEDEDWDEEE